MVKFTVRRKNFTDETKKIKEVNVMRLDKFLKVSRIIKRRTVAKEVADKGRIQINGVLAKSSSTVKIGDLVKIQFGNRILEVEVLQLNDSTKKEDATKMYEIKSETRVSEE
ncbi:S4 domain protein [Enterococcus faecalis F01966]|nr:S4 domain protein [Enterococcus faecalis TX0470]EPH98025.1 S4 domain protein [Enterococcus faecalis F01966]